MNVCARLTAVTMLLLALPVAHAAPRDGGTNLGTPTQNWDRNLPAATRFTVLAEFGGAAVRDNNTGLVWEQAPATSTTSWFPATQVCANQSVGGTSGWRLPSVHELNGVRDPSLPAPFVPANIFTGVQGHDHANYWSASTRADVPTEAWTVFFFNGIVSGATKTSFYYIWCVRGPMNADQY